VTEEERKGSRVQRKRVRRGEEKKNNCVLLPWLSGVKERGRGKREEELGGKREKKRKGRKARHSFPSN